MARTIIAVYDTAEHATQAIAALRRAGTPEAAIHRHIREGDDLVREHPPLVQTEGVTLWSAMFGLDDPLEHVIPESAPEAGGTVVRVTMVPEQHRDAVLTILDRYHPAEMRVPAAETGMP